MQPCVREMFEIISYNIPSAGVVPHVTQTSYTGAITSIKLYVLGRHERWMVSSILDLKLKGQGQTRLFLACKLHLFLIVTTNHHAVVMIFVRLSGTGVHCDHTVHFSTDLSLWLDSPVLWAS